MNKHLILENASFSQSCLDRTAYWLDFLETMEAEDTYQQILQVNRFVNRLVLYREDREVWGVNDYWASPLETLHVGAGDCEDIAILKLISLRLLEHQVDSVRMHYVNLRIGEGTSAHMVIGCHIEDDPLILDSTIDSVRTLSNRRDLTPVYSFNENRLWVLDDLLKKDPKIVMLQWDRVVEHMRRDFNL